MDTKKLLESYDEVIKSCKNIFITKSNEYGNSWVVMRPPSMTDQISIKAWRVRTIWDKKKQKIEDEILFDFYAIINYCIMAIIKLDNEKVDISDENIGKNYDAIVLNNKLLLEKKNHDYGNSWSLMRKESIIDLILVKINRIKHMETFEGRPKIISSEGVASNYMDILNYTFFLILRLGECFSCS